MQVRLLGPFAVVQDGVEPVLGAPRQRALLAMLALAPGRVVSTDLLIDGIWGEDPPGQPLGSLQVYVYGLRKALAALPGGADVLRSAPPGYRLDLAAGATDLARFEQGWARSRELSQSGQRRSALAVLEEALAEWSGPALADLRHLPFAQVQVARLDEFRLAATEDLYDLRLACGLHAPAAGELEVLVQEHPTRERLWGLLMIALYRCDRQADALAAYARTRDRLAEELGIDPGEPLRRLELAILRHDPELRAPDDLATDVVATPPPRPTARVPRPTTATIGRDELAAQVRSALVEPGTRLVTLLAPGGSGKTRLACLVAEPPPEPFAGAVFHEASEEHDAVGLLASLARAVGGPEPEDDSLEAAARVAAASLDPATLVVLDNLEAVTEVGQAVAALLHAAPGVTVLATSRVPLQLEAEVQVPVPPLEVPSRGVTVGAAADSPAVALFVQRARMVNRAFEVTDANVAEVIALCRLLDGVPLALTLAAGQMRSSTPGRALARLQHGLAPLTTPTVDVPARQRAVTTAIAWSLDQLKPEARTLLALLCVFEDGFGLDALESLPSVGAVLAPGADPLEHLGVLLDTGLVRLSSTHVAIRYQVLGTVLAHVRSTEPVDPVVEDRVRAEQLGWLVDRAAEWAALLSGHDGEIALARLDDEYADIAGLVQWATDRGAVDDAAALAWAVHPYWLVSGRLREGCEVIGGLRERGLAPDIRPQLDLALARLRYNLGDVEAAERDCRAVLALDPTPALRAPARCYLAASLVAQGRVEEAQQPARQALAGSVECTDLETQAVTLSVLAIIAAMTGEFDTERTRYRERLEVVRRMGDRARIADTLNTLAEIALDEPDVAAAADHAAEALRLAGARRPIERRDALITAARAAVLARNGARAVELLTEALELGVRTGQPLSVAQCARTLGCLVSERDPATALRLFGLGHALAPPPTGEMEPMEGDLRSGLERARRDLDPAQAQRLWEFGRAESTSLVAAADVLRPVLAGLAQPVAS